MPFCLEPFKIIKFSKIDYITKLSFEDIKKGGFYSHYGIKELYRNLNKVK